MTGSVSQPGSFRKLVAKGNIQDPHGYLHTTSKQGPRYVVLRERGPPDSVIPGHFPRRGALQL